MYDFPIFTEYSMLIQLLAATQNEDVFIHCFYSFIY